MAVQLTLLAHGHTICNNHWAVETQGENFHRLYYVLGGVCHCTIQGRTLSLEPNHLYLFPQNIPYTMTHSVQEPLHVVWQHIRLGDCQLKRELWHTPIGENQGIYHTLKALEALSPEMCFVPESGVITKLIQILLGLLQSQQPIFAPLDSRIAKVIQLVTHGPEGQYTVQQLADFARLERSHFSRLFQRELGITPQAFLLRTRMEWSAQLLLSHNTVEQVASAVGYNDEKAFFRAFARHFGTTPGKYQKYHILQP